MEKISFSKFFPSTQQFVVIRGKAKSPTDFNMSVDIGDGVEKTSFYIDPWHFKENLDMMRTMREAMQQALEFYDKALNLPSIKDKTPVESIFSSWGEKEEKPKAKKPAAKKKAAAKK